MGIKDLKPSKKDYRLFKLEDSADDLSSMKEMLYNCISLKLFNIAGIAPNKTDKPFWLVIRP